MIRTINFPGTDRIAQRRTRLIEAPHPAGGRTGMHAVLETAGSCLIQLEDPAGVFQ